MSLKLALGVVGGAVGFIYGGPAGARWGFMIGSTIGSIVDPGTIKGPSIGDIAQQTSQEGVPRPIVLVRSPPIAGNIIAQSDPRIVKTKSSGKGGPKVVSETVYRTYAVGVCEGPVGGFRRVWRNNVLVYDVSGASIITSDDNDAFLEKARFFTGEYDQDPSPDLEAVFGVGTTPAHRGTCYMVMADEDLTDLRGAIPQWTFEVTNAVGVIWSTDVLDPWTSDTMDPRYAPGDALGGYTYKYFTGTPPEGTMRTTLAAAISDGNAATTPTGAYVIQVGYTFNESSLVHSFMRMSPAYARDPGEKISLYLNYNRYNPGGQYEGLTENTHGNTLACSAFEGFTPPIGGAGSSRYWWSGEYYPSGGSPADADLYVYSGVWRCDFYVNVQPGEQNTNNCSNFSGSPQALLSRDVHIHVYRQPHKPEGDWTSVSGSFKCLAKYHDDGTDVTQYPLNPTMPVGDVLDTEAYWTAAYNSALLDGSVPSGWVYGVDYPQAISTAWTGVGNAVDGAVALPEIVTIICDKAGVPSDLIDVSRLPQADVHGLMITNQYAVMESLRALGQMFFFDISPQDGLLVFVPRGGDHVATITEDDMLDDDQELDPDKRDDSISVPRVIHLLYHDVAGGLNTDQQTSERSGDRRSIGEATIQSPLIMTANEAAQAVVINHKVVIENAKGQLNFSLGDNFLFLTIADPLLVLVDGVYKRVRIEQLDTMDGYQTYKVAFDRQSAYVSDVEGLPAAPQTPPPSSIVGPTLIVPLDIQILKDADDAVGLSYYVAVAGLTPAWTGALVEISYDGGANYIDSQQATLSSTIGELLDSFPDHPPEWPDDTSIMSVRILVPDADLESTDLEGMMNRANLAAIGTPGLGWELINFANAAETTNEGDWTVDYFLRGRKDSDARGHAAGETFVLLDRGILGFITANLTDLNRTLTFRATSFGQPTSSGTVVSMLYTGHSQTERHPGYVMVRRDGVNAVVSWQGVGRLGGGAQAAQGLRFDQYRVTFDDHANEPIVVDTSLTEITQDISSLSVGIPFPDSLLWTNLFHIQRVVKIGTDYYGAKFTADTDNVSSIQRFSGTSNTRTGGMGIGNPGRVTGFLYQGGYIYVSMIKLDGTGSKVYRIDPAAVTIGAVLTFTHEHTGGVGEFQGLATDGTYLYASQAYASSILRMSLATLSTSSTLSLPGSGAAALSYNGGFLYVACRGSDEISVVNLSTFTESFRFSCVQFPLDVVATDDLVFVQSTHELGVYQHDGTEVAVYSAETLHTGAPICQELGYDGARVFRSTGSTLEFYGGASGELTLTFSLSNPAGPVGGYVDGRYFVENIADLVNTTGEVYSSDLFEPTVSVAQLNDLTGAGPSIEVTLP